MSVRSPANRGGGSKGQVPSGASVSLSNHNNHGKQGVPGGAAPGSPHSNVNLASHP